MFFRFFFIYEKSFYLYVDLWAFWRNILAWKYFQYEFAWMTSRWNTLYYKHTLTHRLRYCNLGRFHTESDDFSSSLLPSRQLSCSYLLFPLAPDLSSCSTTVYEHLFPLTFLQLFSIGNRRESKNFWRTLLEHTFSRLIKFYKIQDLP